MIPVMELTYDQGADILQQISQSQWKWLGIKRFVPEAYADLAERYAALEQHHAQETGRMLEVIQAACRTITHRH
jgi:hypothetical protein